MLTLLSSIWPADPVRRVARIGVGFVVATCLRCAALLVRDVNFGEALHAVKLVPSYFSLHLWGHFIFAAEGLRYGGLSPGGALAAALCRGRCTGDALWRRPAYRSVDRGANG